MNGLTEHNGTAQFLLPNCKTLRISAGKKINDLVKASDVSRDTIRKIEKHHPVTEPIVHAVFNALNEWHKNRLDENREITSKDIVR
jgi:DNA-binding XRE family transcriptional regulator